MSVNDIEAVLMCSRAVIDWWEWVKVKVLWGMSVSYTLRVLRMVVSYTSSSENGRWVGEKGVCDVIEDGGDLG